MNSQTRYIRITRQPSELPVRYRYAVEGRHAEVIKGEGSEKNRIVWPEVEIKGCKGESIVLMVSGVTTDKPYRIHPHNLVGPACKDYGVCTIEDFCSTDVTRIEIKNIGVLCAKRNQVQRAIEIRKERNIDPFQCGFNHAKDTDLDLNSLRLCFQVILKKTSGSCESLKPIVSNVVYDVKANSTLKIHRLCKCSDYAKGGASIILLCEKVKRDSIKIKFFQEDNWEAFGEFEPTDVHKQFAICFKVPPYKNPNITDPVRAYIQLEATGRDEEGEITLLQSEPLEFTYIPNPDAVKRKQAKLYQKAKKASLIPELTKLECFDAPSTSQFFSMFNPMTPLTPIENNVYNSNQLGSLHNSMTPTTTATNPFHSTNPFQTPQSTFISPLSETPQSTFISPLSQTPSTFISPLSQLTTTGFQDNTNLTMVHNNNALKNQYFSSTASPNHYPVPSNVPQSNNFTIPTSPQNCQQPPFISNQFRDNTPISPIPHASQFLPNVSPNFSCNELMQNCQPNGLTVQMQVQQTNANTSNFAHHNGFHLARLETPLNDNITNLLNFSQNPCLNNLHALSANDQNTISIENFAINSSNNDLLNEDIDEFLHNLSNLSFDSERPNKDN